MESLPLTAEAIAFTEKKMDMTLGMLYDNFFFSFNYIITHILGLIYSDIFFVYAEDIIKMSKKKNPGGKKPPRQPVNILNCWSTLLHLCSMWKFVNYPSFLHRSKNAHSRMATLLKGMPKFNGSWNLDRPSDKYVAMQI